MLSRAGAAKAGVIATRAAKIPKISKTRMLAALSSEEYRYQRSVLGLRIGASRKGGGDTLEKRMVSLDDGWVDYITGNTHIKSDSLSILLLPETGKKGS